MKIETYIDSLVAYAQKRGLAQPEDSNVIRNRILELLRKEDYAPSGEPLVETLEEILTGMVAYGVENGICEDTVTARDLLDTRIMGSLTPMPREVIRGFQKRYDRSPMEATDWYYQFCQDTDYIRSYRIAKDMQWQYASPYGVLDITINLSKPEKDPKAIAAARNMPQSGYPRCLLCAENEGYAGRMNHPARQNHRIIPLELGEEKWFLQYSPYVYYKEHCIVFNGAHTPMKIDRGTLDKLLEFVSLFPHYFIGSNADLPIVGGSILSHAHFQGGHYAFAMERAEIERQIAFSGYPDVRAGIVKWPMSVIRLDGNDPACLAELGEKILQTWRGYTDAAAGILAETEGEFHNTVTPIARRRGEQYELDLVLRNNLTTQEHPLGVFHPHADKHHIKKENIGLIEVMGLAVLPSRLQDELRALKEVILAGEDIRSDPALSKHADWVEELKSRYRFTQENAWDILLQETGAVFSRVLEDAGVFKRNAEGLSAFLRFVDCVNAKDEER